MLLRRIILAKLWKYFLRFSTYYKLVLLLYALGALVKVGSRALFEKMLIKLK